MDEEAIMTSSGLPPGSNASGEDAIWRQSRAGVGDEGVVFPPPQAGGPLRVVGIAGSLRRGSLNQALLRSTRDLCPPELRIEVHELAGIPLFDQDVEQAGIPAAVAVLREAVGAADGLLLVTPEYNHGVPGVMKNAFDWLSRPPGKSVLAGKPAGIMGASPGITGTARAQTQLRQSFVFTDTPVMPQPEVLVARAHEKFDADGRLTDDGTRAFVTTFLSQFVTWIERFRTASVMHA
jgi:chromate reductase, NAD(P)H dehydrogenase (quinone)